MIVLAIIAGALTWVMSTWKQENETIYVAEFKSFVNDSLKAALKSNDDKNNSINSYSNLTSTYIAERRMVPSKFIKSGPIDLKPPVGDGATISYTTIAGKVDTIAVTVTGVPKGYCVAIVAGKDQTIADDVLVGGVSASVNNITTTCSGVVDIMFKKKVVDANFY